MPGPAPVLSFTGTAFRALPAGADPLAPARAPAGRFHRPGQIAIYLSMSAEGTVVAIRRYLAAGDPPRVIVPLDIAAARLADLTGRAEASAVWQDLHAAGRDAPTWALSDAARQAGMQGLTWSSRVRPDLTHLVIFDIAVIHGAGAPLPFPPPP